MARGSKAIDNTSGHRTKAEIESRKAAESAQLTGVKCFERAAVKQDIVAHTEYKRLVALLQKIGKNDALYGASINRYCELYSEIDGFKKDVYRYRNTLDMLDANFSEMGDSGKLEYEQINQYMTSMSAIITKIGGIDNTIMRKRKMMSDIEKENGWTVLSALRAIPKDVTKNEPDALAAILQSED